MIFSASFLSASYSRTSPAGLFGRYGRLNSHLALTPLALHPHRLKEFNRSQTSVALEFLFSWDFDLTALPRVKSAKLVGTSNQIGNETERSLGIQRKHGYQSQENKLVESSSKARRKMFETIGSESEQQ